MTSFVQELRTLDLYKAAGLSETLDWAAALVALNREALDADVVEQTLGILLKNQEDIESVRGTRLPALLARALAHAAARSEPGAGPAPSNTVP